MMKTKHTCYQIGITALALILAACNNLTGPETKPLPGTARISLGAGEGRTILPDMADYYFTLDFTASGKEDVRKTLEGGTTLIVPLEPAAWTVEVTGFADSARTVLVVHGSGFFTVNPGAETACTVNLTRDFSARGTGSLAYHLDLTGLSSSTTRGSFSLRILDNTPGTGEEIDLSPDVGGTAAGTLTDLPEGAYLAMVDLYDSAANTAAVWTGAVHIDNGSTTTLDRSFSPGDFAEAGQKVIAGTNTLAARLAQALTYPSGSYTISLDGTETDLAAFAPQTLNVTENKDITLTLRGNGHEVQLGSTGNLFTVGAAFGSSLTLVLQDITLRGRNDNTASLVRVGSGGTLEMKAGSLITGNTSSSSYGGGVYVSNNGTFTMSGGSVSGNTSSSYASYASFGGGVYVDNNGTFTMSGGSVSGNTASPAFPSSFANGGGGVYVAGGTFTMSGGSVSGNTAAASTSHNGGGGVYVSGGTFTMSGGSVSGNTARDLGSYGGGIYVSGGTCTRSGGSVSDNTAASAAYAYASSSHYISYGGGVYVSGGTFTMSDGEVSGNTAVSGDSSASASASYDSSGGGVYVSGATFTMSGGEVRGNTATAAAAAYGNASGGGMYVDVSSATFTMSGGTVNGNTAASASASGGGMYVVRPFTMSGGEVRDNILSGTNTYGREVVGNAGSLRISGDAWPQRVFLHNNNRFITITGPLSGGIVTIDLEITASHPLISWLGRSVLVLDSSYGAGNLADLKTHFILENAKMTESPYTEMLLPAEYTIGDDGKLPPPPSNSNGISNIIYSVVSGDPWTLEADGRYRSPSISDNTTTKERVSFTAEAGSVIVVLLEVSSWGDDAFISTLDNDSATYDNGYFTNSYIHGSASVNVSIPVPAAGSHFIDICYRTASLDMGSGYYSDCAWFRVVE